MQTRILVPIFVSNDDLKRRGCMKLESCIFILQNHSWSKPLTKTLKIEKSQLKVSKDYHDFLPATRLTLPTA